MVNTPETQLSVRHYCTHLNSLSVVSLLIHFGTQIGNKPKLFVLMPLRYTSNIQNRISWKTNPLIVVNLSRIELILFLEIINFDLGYFRLKRKIRSEITSSRFSFSQAFSKAIPQCPCLLILQSKQDSLLFPPSNNQSLSFGETRNPV